MNGFTPAQQKAIQGWTEQRDALLREIGNYSAELGTLKDSTKTEGLALADLHRSISEAKGRLLEIDALEVRMRASLPTDVAELEARKSRLEAECNAKEDELKTLDARKGETVASIEALVLAHDRMSDQATIVDQVVGQVIETSKTAITDVKEMMLEIQVISTSVIDKSNENIAQANIVIDKMPKVIFDMQRPIPVRRTYPVGHPNHVQGLDAA